MMFQGPKSVLELLTLKHRRIHYREADARKLPPAGEYNPQPDYTVDKRRVTKGDDYAKATVRRPLHATPFEIVCEDWTPLPKLNEGNLRFVVTLIILGNVKTVNPNKDDLINFLLRFIFFLFPFLSFSFFVYFLNLYEDIMKKKLKRV